jgi:hypothetical protein
MRAKLMRRVADRLDAPKTCPTRTCRRRHTCNGAGIGESEPPCRRAASPEDSARFDELSRTVEAIVDGTLWPEPAVNAGLRMVEETAIGIVREALPLMPGFAEKFEAWMQRYFGPPASARDNRAFLRYARAEVARNKEICKRLGI